MERLDRLENLLLRDLRVLVALAERKHFAQTAEEFGLSQPSLSAIVKKVEAAFGVTIFARTSRKFVITPEGEAILRQTRAVLEEVARLATIPDAHAAPLVGLFRLGIIPTLGPYYLPHILGALAQNFPDLELVLIEAKTEELLHQLRQREVDAALMALPLNAADMEESALFREEFLLAVPEGHPLAGRERVAIEEVDLKELLMLERGNCLRDQTLDACGASRPGSFKPIHAASIETLRYMVATRIGTAILPRLAVPLGPTDLPVRYVRFQSPEPGRIVGLVQRQHGTRGKDGQALAGFLRAHPPHTQSSPASP